MKIEGVTDGYRSIIINLKENLKYIFIKGATFSMTALTVEGFYFTFFNPDEDEISKKSRLFVTFIVVLGAYLGAILWILFIRKKKIIYIRKMSKIVVEYASLLEMLKQYEREKRQGIFIIPVNRCFDTVVNDVLIEKTTIHGQIIEYLKETYTEQKLEQVIQSALEAKKINNLVQLEREEKKNGNLKRYPVGTIVEIITANENVLYLAAFTEFQNENEKIVARSNLYEYSEFLQSVIDYSFSDGRNLPIYMPAVGCGNSRLGIEVEDSIQKIVTMWKMNSGKLRNDVHIVIPKEKFAFVQLDKFH